MSAVYLSNKLRNIQADEKIDRAARPTASCGSTRSRSISPLAALPRCTFLELPDMLRLVEGSAKPYRAISALAYGAGRGIEAPLSLHGRGRSSRSTWRPSRQVNGCSARSTAGRRGTIIGSGVGSGAFRAIDCTIRDTIGPSSNYQPEFRGMANQLIVRKRLTRIAGAGLEPATPAL